MREDFECRLREKDTEIKRLRAEAVSRSVMMAAQAEEKPRSLRAFTEPQATQQPISSEPTDWQGELNKMLKEEEEKDDAHSE